MLKTFLEKDNADHEREIVMRLGNRCDEFRIEARALEGPCIDGLVLEACDGDLLSWRRDTHLWVWDGTDGEAMTIRLVHAIARALQCFLQLGYFYTDIKAPNILYKKVGSCFKVYLGDLGSATAQGTSAT
jgi:serine/threonine protein kinase